MDTEFCAHWIGRGRQGAAAAAAHELLVTARRGLRRRGRRRSRGAAKAPALVGPIGVTVVHRPGTAGGPPSESRGKTHPGITTLSVSSCQRPGSASARFRGPDVPGHGPRARAQVPIDYRNDSGRLIFRRPGQCPGWTAVD